MNFLEIARARQSCRAYDETKEVESEKLEAILEAARIAPSACNGQPYKITVCRGRASQEVALACRGLGMNKFATDAPVLLVISERPYVASAALGEVVVKLKHIPHRPLRNVLICGCRVAHFNHTAKVGSFATAEKVVVQKFIFNCGLAREIVF